MLNLLQHSNVLQAKLKMLLFVIVNVKNLMVEMGQCAGNSAQMECMTVELYALKIPLNAHQKLKVWSKTLLSLLSL